MNSSTPASAARLERPTGKKPSWVSYSGWPESLIEEIRQEARERSVRERKRITASQVALEWVLLGQQHAEAPETT